MVMTLLPHYETSDVRIEKKSTGAFAIITRPAFVANGGRTAAVVTLSDASRILDLEPQLPLDLFGWISRNLAIYRAHAR